MSRSQQKPKDPITDKGHTLTFGRYKGQTLQTILEDDPNYITWLSEEGVLDIHSSIVDEALEKLRRWSESRWPEIDPKGGVHY